MARILVTGSRGVVGKTLQTILEESRHSVFGLDRYHEPGERGFVQTMSESDFTYARCDITSYRQIERVFEEAGPFDFVYHIAAEFGRWNGEDYYEQVWKTNCIGTKHIIRLQEERDFKLIHFSSSEVYGDYSDVMREDVMEQEVIHQMNDYALSKKVNEEQIRNSMELFDTDTVIVRLFNTYGPGETYHPYRSVTCKFCYHALKGWPITVYRGHKRTSTYLRDCCRTLSNIVENFKSGEVYNIGGDDYHDIETLAQQIWDIAGADPDLISYEEEEQLTTKVKKVDVSKAKKDLDHECLISLEEGLNRTIEWMQSYYNL